MSSDPRTLHGPADEFERLAAVLAPDVTVVMLEPGEAFDLPARIGTGAGS
jgi:hypothetical protein